MELLPSFADGSRAFCPISKGALPCPQIFFEGELVKTKSGHRRYIVLWADCPDRDSVARLEIFTNKYQFDHAMPPKRTILATAMQGVAASDPKVRWRRSSNKDSDEPEVQVGLCFVLSLNHMGGKNLHLGTNSKNCYQKWMALLRDFITGNALSAAEDLHCENVFTGLKLSQSDQGAKICDEFKFPDAALCSFCFDMHELVLIRARQSTPFFIIDLPRMRQCSAHGSRITIHSGRSGPYGEGFVHLEAQSATQAEEIKSKLYEVLQSGAPQRGGPIVSSQISATPLSETADQVSGQFKSCTLPSLRCVPLQSRAEVLMTVVKTPSIHGEAGSGLLAVQTSTEDGCMEYASQSCSEGDVYQEMAPNTFTEPKALSNRSRYRPTQAGHFPRVLQRGVPQRGEPIVSSQIPATDVYQEMAPNTFTEPTALSNRSRYRPAQAGHFPQVLQSGVPQRGKPIVSSQISATPLSETADQVSGQFKSCALPSLRCVPLQSRAEVLMTVVKTPSIHGDVESGLLAVQASTEDGCMEYASQSCSEGDVYQEMAPNTFTEPKALSNRSRYRPAQAGHFPQVPYSTEMLQVPLSNHSAKGKGDTGYMTVPPKRS